MSRFLELLLLLRLKNFTVNGLTQKTVIIVNCHPKIVLVANRVRLVTLMNDYVLADISNVLQPRRQILLDIFLGAKRRNS